MYRLFVSFLALTLAIVFGFNSSSAAEQKKAVEQNKAIEMKKERAEERQRPGAKGGDAQEAAARSKMIKSLEKELGKPLTQEQQQLILSVMRANADIARSAHQSFMRSVGTIFEIRGKEMRELGAETIKDGFSLEKDVIAVGEKKLGRKINQVERKIIVDLNDLREMNMRKTHENVASGVAMITGVPAKKVMELVPPIGVGRRR